MECSVLTSCSSSEINGLSPTVICRPLAEGTGSRLIYSAASKNRQGTVSRVQTESTHTLTNAHCTVRSTTHTHTHTGFPNV